MTHLFVTVVSGLPRSGTSLMMQMLAAGGAEVLTDGGRKPDQHNPRGYFELEAVKYTRTDHAWLAQAEGCALHPSPSLVMRWFLDVGLHPFQLQRLHSGGLPLSFLTEPVQQFSLLDNHAVQLLDLMLEVCKA